MVKHFLATTNEKVVASCRNIEKALDLNDLVAKYGNDRLLLVPLDVASQESQDNAKSLMQAEGINKIDILIANAGMQQTLNSI